MAGQIFINEVRCNFNLREPKADKPTNIYLVASINNKQVKLATGVKVYPSQWNAKKQEAYVSVRLTELDNTNNTIANDKLNELKNSFVEFKHYLCEHPKEIEQGIELLKKYIYKDNMKKEESQPINVGLYLKQCIDKDNNITDGTRITYSNAVRLLERFIKENGIIIKSFNEIDTKFFNDFQTFLLSIDDAKTTDGTLSVPYINNTIKTIHQRIEAYVVKFQLMDRSKFLDIVQPLLKDKTDDYKIALRDDEVLKLWNYKPKDNNDEVVRDIFLLNCLTGQRISDTEKVDDNLEDILDVTTIKLIQKKTGKYLNFSIIFELAKEILNKYPNGLPKVNTTILNARIKEIAKEAGITGKEVVGRQTKDGLNTTYKERYECITTHTGRRTFITLLKLRGWDDGKITMYSGHKDDRMVKRYTKIKDTAAFERFNKTKKEHPELLLRMVGESISNDDNKEFVLTTSNDILNYLFALDKSKELLPLLLKGIDITGLDSNINYIVSVIKDTNRLANVIDKAREVFTDYKLRDDAIVSLRMYVRPIIEQVGKLKNDATLLQMYFNTLDEIGLISIDELPSSLDIKDYYKDIPNTRELLDSIKVIE